MGNSKMLCHFFMFFIINVSFSSSFNSIRRCPDEQRDALLVFKQNISSINQSYVDSDIDENYCGFWHKDHRDAIRMNWNMSIDCCEWDGVTCDNFTGDVTGLNLRCGMLQGVLELDTLLSKLTKLEVVDLSYSGIFVVVTRNDAHYVNSNLHELRLAYCNLNVFPDFLRAMKNLQVLDLSGNYISGSIPDWAGEIGGNNLTYLDLSDNTIASWPKFKSDALQYLYLESTLLQGSFPLWICNMKHLKQLDVSHNKISGKFPQCLRNISSSLEFLDVRSNMIQGPFPMTTCNMSNLLWLDLSDNSFHGVIPQCLGNITSSIIILYLGGNKFHGIIPEVYGPCEHLTSLSLRSNKLEGDVPRSLAKCQSLEILDLQNNQLNGTFPRWLGDLPKLHILCLNSNNLHGTIKAPSTFEFLFPSVYIFDISNNGFIGPLPGVYFENFNAIKDVDKHTKAIFTDPTLTSMNLSSNRFEGEIPDTIGNLKSLISLNLSNNKLNGQIPHVLGNLFNMTSLDLSRNQLVGEIPLQELNVFATIRFVAIGLWICLYRK